MSEETPEVQETETKPPLKKPEKKPYEPPRSVRDPEGGYEPHSEAELKAIDAEKRFRRAGIEFDKGDIDEALMLIRSALSMSPGNSKYHYNAAFLYWRKDLLEVALNHYKMFVRYALDHDKDLELVKGRITYLEKEIKARKTRR